MKTKNTTILSLGVLFTVLASSLSMHAKFYSLHVENKSALAAKIKVNTDIPENTLGTSSGSRNVYFTSNDPNVSFDKFNIKIYEAIEAGQTKDNPLFDKEITIPKSDGIQELTLTNGKKLKLDFKVYPEKMIRGTEGVVPVDIGKGKVELIINPAE